MFLIFSPGIQTRNVGRGFLIGWLGFVGVWGGFFFFLLLFSLEFFCLICFGVGFWGFSSAWTTFSRSWYSTCISDLSGVFRDYKLLADGGMKTECFLFKQETRGYVKPRFRQDYLKGEIVILYYNNGRRVKSVNPEASMQQNLRNVVEKHYRKDE